MSDDMDAQLGALFDSVNGTGGESVIDTSGDGAVHSDTRAKPGERADFFNSTDGAWEAELAKAHDRSIDKQTFEENSKALPARVGESFDERLGKSFDHVQRLDTPAGREQIQFENAAHIVLRNKIEMARQFNLDIMGPDGKTVDPVKLGAIDNMINGTTGSEGQAIPRELAAVLPEAKSVADIAAYTQAWRGVESDIATHGAAAIVHHGQQRGFNVVDADDPRVQADMAARYGGQSYAQIRQYFGDPSREEHEAGMSRAYQLGQTEALVDAFSATHPDFKALEPAMMEIIPALRQQNPNLTAGELLDAAYQAASRGPKKSGADRTIEAVGEKQYARRR